MVSISLGTSGKLDKSGGTLTGPLILARDPQQPFEAATRQWVLANAGSGGAGGIPASTVTAKGDLLAATGAGAVTRLAAGTDGQVLSAASGQPTGLQWTSLGSAATQNTSAFDAAGSASAALTAAEANAAATYLPLAGGTLSGPLAMGSNKLTGLANGSAATDGAAFGQIPLIGAAGSGATKALSANDPTTANSRTPTAHAGSHAVGGSDVLTPDAIGAVGANWADMLGVALLTAPFTASGVTYQQTPGDYVLQLCTATKTRTISKLALWVTAAGVTGSGVNALVICDEAGNLIDQTGDMTTAWSSTGMPEGTLGGSHIVTAGTNYYLGFLTHFSGTSPHCGATGTAQTANFPLANGHRTAIFKSGVTSVPLSFDPASYTPNSGYFVMYAR